VSTFLEMALAPIEQVNSRETQAYVSKDD